uniref:Uncharacterized protein n=1 Tax=Arundo donax TaxID=35708 RepID=A0A0A9BA92_ARUDO
MQRNYARVRSGCTCPIVPYIGRTSLSSSSYTWSKLRKLRVFHLHQHMLLQHPR